MKKANRIYLKQAQFNMVRQVLQGRGIYYIAGTYSMFVPSRKEKYIMSSSLDGTTIVRQWHDLQGHLEMVTPSEAARFELQRTFPGLKKVGWQANDVKLFSWRWPMLFTGTHKGNGSYIDLTGAYHQLYGRLWLDVAFPCGYGSLSLSQVAVSLAEWKAARNSVIGITAARDVVGVKGYKSVYLKTQNPYLSPHLWATIQAILNELAFLAERLGAIYIATDGYIFPKRSQADEFEEYLLNYGLKFRRTNGKVDVRGWGAYCVPGKRTKPYDLEKNGQGTPFRSINILDTDNPTRLLVWWARSIPRYSRCRWEGGIKEWQMTV
jgi:hypothetical protein